MDYYGLMVHTHRLLMAALAAALLTGTMAVVAQPVAAKGNAQRGATAAKTAETESNAALDAELFYEVLLGEMTIQSGDPGSGYALMLEAARRSNDEKLYRRAADIALQARSGDAALQAANAWKEARPQSRDANRYVLQILVALNRVADSAGPLKQELAQTAVQAKAASFQALPQIYRRVSDKTLAAAVVEQALAEDLASPTTGAAAWTAVGRMRLLANDKAGALDAAQRAQQLDPISDGPALLALELLDARTAQADAVAARYFAGKPSPALRAAYARVLVNQQRNEDSLQQLQAATSEKPDFAEAWLMQAALQFQLKQLAQAQKSLEQFEALAQAVPEGDARRAGLSQAYLLHAQIAERRGDYEAADAWLNRIDSPQDMFSAQSQRAFLLGRQGKLAQARALLQSLPVAGPDDERMKLLAEVQLLRDAGQYREAYALQGKAVAQFPDDNELLYDHAMLADKAGQPEAMERLLRQLMARQPDYHHAYNALGYSLAERGIRLEEAKELIQKALEFAPQDPFITDSLGWVEFRLGNRTEAARLLNLAFKSRPDAEIAAHLGEVLWSLGDKEQARSIWKQGQQLNADNDTLRETLKRLGAGL
ncbi:hypothetical protein B2J86_03460 [Acidovorax sp. SRB_14]|uniref:tetratricopeptide repeat protein n=1 Tax=Acidovorax sp. SRB_14 TaxID=1962699 RepID=UPI001564D1E2|nr:tetratricopeptide repeat protein [Acidovorax sp. SRB_14]NMM79995.1 hypothetical protein [Acidovorax sp. SRB_14]